MMARAAREQEPQGIRNAQDLLARRLLGKHLVHQQCRALGHAPRPTAGTEAAAFATERHQVFGVTAVAAHPQEAMLKTAAFER